MEPSMAVLTERKREDLSVMSKERPTAAMSGHMKAGMSGQRWALVWATLKGLQMARYSELMSEYEWAD